MSVKKIVLISVSSVVALLATLWAVLTFVVIDADAVATEIKTALEKATGREVSIPSGSATLFPPQIVYHDVRVSNIDGASTREFLSVSSMTIRLGAGSLITFSPKVSEIVLDGASIQFEALPNGNKNWHFTGKQQDASAFRTYFLDAPIQLRNSLLRYANASANATSELTGLNGTLRYLEGGKEFAYDGEVMLHAGEAQVKAKMQSVDLTQATVPEVPMEVSIQQNETRVHVKGKLASASKEPQFNGQIEVDLPSIAHFFEVFLPAEHQTAIPADAAGKFSAKGNISAGISRIQLSNFELLGSGGDAIPVLKGVVEADYQFGGKPVLEVSGDLESVDFDFMRKTYASMLLPEGIAPVVEKQDVSPATAGQPAKKATAQTAWREFITTVVGTANLTVDNFLYNGRSIRDVQLKSDIAEGNFRLNSGYALLPGETRTTFSANVKFTPRGLIYDGKTELHGRKMEEFLGLFAPSDVNVPPVELGMFAIRTNFAGTPEQFRLSEMQARVTDTRMAGALVFHLQDRVKLETFIRIAGVNLDTAHAAVQYLLPKDEGVKEAESTLGGERLFDVEYVNTQFRWLNTVAMDVDAEILMEKFVLFERSGENAKFNLHVEPGVLALKGMNANYNGANITGDYALKVFTNQNPLIELAGNVSELNLADVLPNIARVQNDEEWEKFLEQPIELQNLQSWRGAMNMKVGKLIIRNYSFDNATIKGQLQNNQLELEQFDALLWNGKVQLRSVIQAGTIPSFSVAFVLENANLVRLSQMTALVKHAAGQLGIRGQLATSGVSLRSWFKNANGAVSIIGQEASVQGFGLTTLANAVPVARAVADLIAARQGALQGGLTRLRSIDGQLNMNNGLLEITRMVYSSDEASGNVAGTIDFMRESIDLKSEFYLRSTVEQGEAPPKMTLSLKGPIDSVKKELEMQEVEAYVARKAAERTLQRR